MSAPVPERPTADSLLARIQERDRARLRIYIGAAPGVGKTYEMLQEAHALPGRGLDVVIGFVETYGRRDTEIQINRSWTLAASGSQQRSPLSTKRSVLVLSVLKAHLTRRSSTP